MTSNPYSPILPFFLNPRNNREAERRPYCLAISNMQSCSSMDTITEEGPCWPSENYPYRRYGIKYSNAIRLLRLKMGRRLTTRTKKDVLVVGHPRSGTGYMAKLLQTYGLDVGHERMGGNGISSWMFAAVTTSVPHSFDGSARSFFKFDYVFHVIRHPLPVIASTAYTEIHNLKSFRYMSRFIVIDRSHGLLERACQSYLGWNKLIDAQNPRQRLRVETATENLPPLLKELGLWNGGRPLNNLPSTNYNSRPHPQITARELKMSVSSALWGELVDYATEIGYSGLEGR